MRAQYVVVESEINLYFALCRSEPEVSPPPAPECRDAPLRRAHVTQTTSGKGLNFSYSFNGQKLKF